MQRLADLIGRTVEGPQIKETTALGAAYLAGLHAGFFPEPLMTASRRTAHMLQADRFLDRWRLERRFTPQMDAAMRERKLGGWSGTVGGLLA
jgi:glycerol kinase